MNAVLQRASLGALACFLASSCLAAAPQKANKVVVLDTGIVLQVPQNWKQKKQRNALVLTIPEKTGDATVSLYSVDFRASAERWQTAQANVVVDSRKNLVKQSSLDVNSVPLLLTEATYSSKGVLRNTLAGLYYAAVKHKLLFRIDSPSASFDQVRTDWMAAFVTLATTDGSTLIAEDPSRPLTAAEAASKPTKVSKDVVILPAANQVEKLKGTAISGETAARQVQIIVPKDWTAKAVSASEWVLTSALKKVSVQMSLASTLDSSDPETALLTVSGKSLNDFSLVKQRDEKLGVNRAGAKTDWILRQGTGKSGILSTFEASVSSGVFYVIYHLEEDSKLDGARLDALKDLVDQTYASETAASAPAKS